MAKYENPDALASLRSSVLENWVATAREAGLHPDVNSVTLSRVPLWYDAATDNVTTDDLGGSPAFYRCLATGDAT